MLVHGAGIDRGHDDGGTDHAGGTDRAEQVDAVVTIVSHQVLFWPTRASSPNQISMGFPAASASKASTTKPAKFFQKPLAAASFWGEKDEVQARQTELAHPFSDRAFRHRDIKPPRHSIAQVDTTPTHHVVLFRVRTPHFLMTLKAFLSIGVCLIIRSKRSSSGSNLCCGMFGIRS